MGTYTTKHGIITLNGDPMMEAGLERDAAFMYEDVEVCLPLIHGGTVLDVGAHVGLWCIPASTKAEKVIAFEAREETAKQLLHNITQNNITNVTVVRKIVGDRDKRYTESTTRSSGSNHYTEGEGESAEPLDAYAHERVSFIKIDVEGMEPVVLRSGKKILAQRPLLFIEVNPRTLTRAGFTPKDISRELHDYVFYRSVKGVFYRMPFLLTAFYNVLAVPKEQEQPHAHSFLSFVSKRVCEKVSELFARR
jgi:FkbM family methyltransferase